MYSSKLQRDIQRRLFLVAIKADDQRRFDFSHLLPQQLHLCRYSTITFIPAPHAYGFTPRLLVQYTLKQSPILLLQYSQNEGEENERIALQHCVDCDGAENIVVGWCCSDDLFSSEAPPCRYCSCRTSNQHKTSRSTTGFLLGNHFHSCSSRPACGLDHRPHSGFS